MILKLDITFWLSDFMFSCWGQYSSTSNFGNTLPLNLLDMDRVRYRPLNYSQNLEHALSRFQNTFTPWIPARWSKPLWQCGSAGLHCVGFSRSLLAHPVSLGVSQAKCKGKCRRCHGYMSPGRSHLRAWRSSVNLDSESQCFLQSILYSSLIAAGSWFNCHTYLDFYFVKFIIYFE